jgi:hypothetical protein
LHAEVTAWHALSGTSDPSTCESLWSRVFQMEPICRNRNVLSMPADSSHSEVHGAFLPLENLMVGARKS